LTWLTWIMPQIDEVVTRELGDHASVARLAYPLHYGAIAWACLVAIAAVCTVSLVASTRRTALRQIQESLAELTEQVRQMSTQS